MIDQRRIDAPAVPDGKMYAMSKFVIGILVALALASCGLPIKPADQTLMSAPGSTPGAPCSTGCGH
jgi:hypothetical protein